MGSEVGHAFRRLLKTPSSTAVAILALSLGIGFVTVTYSVADVLLYRPLPVEGLDQVVMIHGRMRDTGRPWYSMSGADYAEWQRSARTVEKLALTRGYDATLTGAGDPLAVRGCRVTASFFDAIRMSLELGRAFTPAEEKAGDERVAVLAYNLWQRQFGGDPAVVGREIELNGRRVRVVGVAREGFAYPAPSDLWTPLVLAPDALQNDANFYLRSIARLRPGVGLGEARAELQAIGERMSARYPSSHSKVSTDVSLVREVISGNLMPPYMRLAIGSALLLLLVACANVSGLQLARVLSRAHEFSIRSALGASRGNLLAQVVIEALIIAAAGAALGALMASWILDVTRVTLPAETQRHLPAWYRLGLNGYVVAWTALTAALAGLFSAAAPGWWLSRSRALAAGLHEVGRTATGSRGRLRMALVAMQAAFALVLLVGAGLMARGFERVRHLDLRADLDHTLTFRVVLPRERYEGHAAVARFENTLIEKLRVMPGVAGVALASTLPGADAGTQWAPLNIVGRPAEPGAPRREVQVEAVSRSFFAEQGAGAVEGRLFAETESDQTPPVLLVNQSFARRYFAGRSALGERLDLGDGRPREIVGVVNDLLYDVTQREPAPVVYQSYQQAGWGGFDMAVRARANALELAPAVRGVVRSIDPRQPVLRMGSYRQLLDDTTAGIAALARMLMQLAIVGALLAMVGIYAQMSWQVNERRREIGVRMALGASQAGILWAALRRSAVTLGIGIAVGLPAAYAGARLLASLLFGVRSDEVLACLLMPLVLVALAALASLGPARSAARIDPVEALRHE